MTPAESHALTATEPWWPETVATVSKKGDEEHAKEGEMCDNKRASNEAAPAGNRGLTTDCLGVQMAKANHTRTESVGEQFSRWMSRADGCDCGNLQPPRAVLPRRIGYFIASYVCADCGAKWERHYRDEIPA